MQSTDVIPSRDDIRYFFVLCFITNHFFCIFVGRNQFIKTMNSDDVPVAICSDHAGYELKEFLLDWLSAKNLEFINFGTYSPDSCDYADFAHPLAEAVEDGEASFGIAICGSGQGVCMTVNKHQGIRGALCWMPEMAKLSRQHNNANVLCLPARFVSKEDAIKIVEAFLGTPFDGGRHQTRIDKMPL